MVDELLAAIAGILSEHSKGKKHLEKKVAFSLGILFFILHAVVDLQNGKMRMTLNYWAGLLGFSLGVYLTILLIFFIARHTKRNS